MIEAGLDIRKNFRYNCLIGLGQGTETDIRVSLA